MDVIANYVRQSTNYFQQNSIFGAQIHDFFSYLFSFKWIEMSVLLWKDFRICCIGRPKNNFQNIAEYSCQNDFLYHSLKAIAEKTWREIQWYNKSSKWRKQNKISPIIFYKKSWLKKSFLFLTKGAILGSHFWLGDDCYPFFCIRFFNTFISKKKFVLYEAIFSLNFV